MKTKKTKTKRASKLDEQRKTSERDRIAAIIKRGGQCQPDELRLMASVFRKYPELVQCSEFTYWLRDNKPLILAFNEGLRAAASKPKAGPDQATTRRMIAVQVLNGIVRTSIPMPSQKEEWVREAYLWADELIKQS